MTGPDLSFDIRDLVAATSDSGSLLRALLRDLIERTPVTGWQSHSVRGFLSGTVSKKMGLKVTSDKGENGERTYSVKA